MEYGICNLSIVPIRSNNSHKSELISQLLYGDCFKLIAEEKDWIKIITLSDEYTGWIDKKQFVHISKDIAEEIKSGYGDPLKNSTNPKRRENKKKELNNVFNSNL